MGFFTKTDSGGVRGIQPRRGDPFLFRLRRSQLRVSELVV
jgi:hypothetical protein